MNEEEAVTEEVQTILELKFALKQTLAQTIRDLVPPNPVAWAMLIELALETTYINFGVTKEDLINMTCTTVNRLPDVKPEPQAKKEKGNGH